MHLTGRHEVYLSGCDGKLLKIDAVGTAATGKIDQVVKRMPVRKFQSGVPIEVVTKVLCYDICVEVPCIGQCTDIINRNGVFYLYLHFAKLRQPANKM